MGALTITITGDASVGTKGKTYSNFSDADVNRLVAYAKSLLPGTPTVAQALGAYCDKMVAGIKNDVYASEQAAILASVAPITVT